MTLGMDKNEIRLHNLIIVLVINKRHFQWYISEKELWILDYKRFNDAFGSEYRDHDYSDRFGMSVVHEENVDKFLEEMSTHQVKNSFLRKLIVNDLPLESWDKNGSLFPSLFIDFDNKKLYSVYSELTRFEEFVPPNWEGIYDDFYDLIPLNEKYWIVDGKDHFKLLI